MQVPARLRECPDSGEPSSQDRKPLILSYSLGSNSSVGKTAISYVGLAVYRLLELCSVRYADRWFRSQHLEHSEVVSAALVGAILEHRYIRSHVQDKFRKDTLGRIFVSFVCMHHMLWISSLS